MSESEKINIWVIRMDVNYDVQGQIFQLKMAKTDNIHRMKEQAMTRTMLHCDIDTVRILKIGPPVSDPKPRYRGWATSSQHGDDMGSTSQEPHSFDQFMQQLSNLPLRTVLSGEAGGLVEPLSPQIKVADCFPQEKCKLVQAIVMHPSLARTGRRPHFLSISEVIVNDLIAPLRASDQRKRPL